MTDDVRNSFDRPSAVPWPPILIVAIVVGALVLGAYFPLPWPGLDDWPARAIGIGFGILGLLLIIWAAATLSRHQTTIMPHKASTALVTSGPFRRFRNPIYLGDVFIFLGIAELTKNIWFAILAPVFMGLITWLAILPEERHLESKFGDAYRAYKASTRRWI
jgi:protein-S-isoprenylcysteine O-methyltransferase Ste14